MSSLTWIDFDAAERDRAQRIMALFDERETRDELGLGGIRDSIADHLFPGTSTIQTRLRYMLFIPWVLRKIEDRDARPDQLANEARSLELKLSNALLEGGETLGVIGRDAGARLKRLPSAVYWAGLGNWGIRQFPGSIDSYFSSIRDFGRRRRRFRESEESVADSSVTYIWHPSLPMAPNNFLESTTFALSLEESEFLIDRLVGEQPNSLLAFLAKKKLNADCDFIWEHPNYSDFPEASRSLVRYAEIFSGVMHGAALLYNLQLSELRKLEDWIEYYEGELERWSDQLDYSAVEVLKDELFWAEVKHPNHKVRPLAKEFVKDWAMVVSAGAREVASSMSARALIRSREEKLKLTQSRFTNRSVRDRWGGASGADRLTFRWAQAKSHLQDLANAS